MYYKMQVWMYGHAYGLDLTVRNKVCITKKENAKLELILHLTSASIKCSVSNPSGLKV